VLSEEVSKVKCRVYKDNIGAKTIATVPRFRPRTKHINIRYWHFIELMEEGLIDIQSVKSKTSHFADSSVEVITSSMALLCSRGCLGF
jgi:hypothetical protein